MSEAPALPADVQGLLNRVDSYEQLEALLFLRSRPSQALTAKEVAAELGASPDEVERALMRLHAMGLLATAVGEMRAHYRFEPADAGSREAVDHLAEAYSESRLEVMRTMTANAIDRLRTDAVRAFADAFVLGRKKDG